MARHHVIIFSIIVAMTNCSWIFNEHEHRSMLESASMASLFPVSTEPAVLGALGGDRAEDEALPIVDKHAGEGMWRDFSVLLARAKQHILSFKHIRLSATRSVEPSEILLLWIGSRSWSSARKLGKLSFLSAVKSSNIRSSIISSWSEPAVMAVGSTDVSAVKLNGVNAPNPSLSNADPKRFSELENGELSG